MCERLSTTFARERVHAVGTLLARQLQCHSCLACDKTIAGRVCLYWTGEKERYSNRCLTTKVHRTNFKEIGTFEPSVRQGKCSANRQTVSQTAGIAQLPSARQNDNQVHS